MDSRFREAFKTTPFRALLSFGALYFYKIMIAPLLHSLGGVGLGCRYPQSCSEFAAASILEEGVIRGSYRAASRLCSCNPWTQPKSHLMFATSKKAI